MKVVTTKVIFWKDGQLKPVGTELDVTESEFSKNSMEKVIEKKVPQKKSKTE